jgi:hypothetical protein
MRCLGEVRLLQMQAVQAELKAHVFTCTYVFSYAYKFLLKL